jgi:hypothetical protein
MMARASHQFSNMRSLDVVRRLVAAAIITATALALPAPLAFGQSRATAAAAVLHDLRGVATLRADFNRDRSKVRIVLLLSPT